MFARILFLFSLLAVASTSQAGRVQTLFQAEVDAAGRDTVSRDAALSVALGEVLVRLTGSTDSLQTPEAHGLLKKPGRFVEQFRFRESAADASRPEQLSLWVQFDGVALAREVRAAGLPYWGRERPDLLLWLAIDNRGQRYLMSETYEPGATNARAAGKRHGLPLTLPLMDLEDQRAIQFTDVWGGFMGTIATASRRYRPQVVLTGRLERSGASGDWRTAWQLTDGGNSQSWKGHADSLHDAVDAGLGDAAEWLAVRYAVVSAESGMWSLVVEEISNLEDYARVSAYLGSLSPVEKVNVLRAEDREVEFSLKLSADASSLQQLITLGRVLQPIEAEDAPWRYRLNP
jgi:hypothetical protein